jgi:hypothetical protein
MHLLLCLLPGCITTLEADPPAEPVPVAEVRNVIAGVRRAAEENAGRTQRTITGDALADHYIRRAASTAAAEKVSTRAFLLALGVVFDDTSLLRSNPLMGRVLTQFETVDERKERLRILGKPTLRGRHDWIMHFSIAAALTAQLGADSAEQLSIAKELWDANGGSGFSFGDLAADYAGIAFARGLLAQKDAGQLRLLAETFRGDDFLDKNHDLEEGLQLDRFTKLYGNVGDPRFLKRKDAIRERVGKMPGLVKLSQPPADK